MRIFYYIFIFLFTCSSLIGQTVKKGPSGKPLPVDYKKMGINPIKDLNFFVPQQNTIISTPIFSSADRIGALTKPKNVGNIQIISINNEGRPTWISGRSANADQRSNLSVEKRAYAYLNDLRKILSIENVENEFVITRNELDELGMRHVRFEQIFKGVPILGAEIIIHSEADKFNTLNGLTFPTPTGLEVVPSISSRYAEDLVKAHLLQEKVWKDITNKDLDFFKLDRFSTDLAIQVIERDARLVYSIKVYPNILSQYQYIIDARTGIILDSWINSCQLHNHDMAGTHCSPASSKVKVNKEKNTVQKSLGDGPATTTDIDLNNQNRLIHTYEVGSDFMMVDVSRDMYDEANSNPPNDFTGIIITLDALSTSPSSTNFTYEVANSSNNDWTKKEVSAHFNGGEAYEYFRLKFGRNSINGSGGDVVSLINVVDENGDEMDNAFWNGAAMFYGNGKSAFKPLAGALDVAGHEIGHGVVQTTANLTYQGESGALNESFADVFGSMIDRDDWQIGEDVVTNVFPSGALRDMSNPNNGGNTLGDPGWQPAHTNEMYNGTQDNGGVHINSGIPNHAFFKFATSSGVGKDKAEQVYYRALNNYLTKSSQFVDMRLAVEKAAADLYNQAVVDAAKNAFSAVGIGEGSGGNYQQDIQTNPGDDYILMTDINFSALYIANPDGDILFNPLLEVSPISKPSITDDGTVIVFVDSDRNLYYIVMDWENGAILDHGYLQESPQAIWRNIIISPQGNTVALLTDEEIPELIVISFDLDDIKTFELYNPTFTQGVSTGDVLYADAMEFDKSGQFVMYDAYNELEGDGFQTINYWDVSFIHVWDDIAKNWGTENVEKLFTSLPDEVSIGNATFSKNSPYIIAFDYIDQSGIFNEYYLRAANIETGEVGDIFSNVRLSYPNYSIEDDRMVFDAESDTGSELLGMIDLADNKIAPSGSAFGYVNQGKWAVWFADGERDLNTDVYDHDIKDKILKFYPNPAENEVVLEFNSTENNDAQLSVFNILGSKVHVQQIKLIAGQNYIKLDVRNLVVGNYIMKLCVGNDVYTGKLNIVE